MKEYIYIYIYRERERERERVFILLCGQNMDWIKGRKANNSKERENVGIGGWYGCWYGSIRA